MWTVLWFAVLFVLSVIPSSGVESDLPLDKVAHALAYGLTAIILIRSFRRRFSRMASLMLAVVIASGYGAAMELVQRMLPYRQFSGADMIANAAGAAVLGAAYLAWSR